MKFEITIDLMNRLLRTGAAAAITDGGIVTISASEDGICVQSANPTGTLKTQARTLPDDPVNIIEAGAAEFGDNEFLFRPASIVFPRSRYIGKEQLLSCRLEIDDDNLITPIFKVELLSPPLSSRWSRCRPTSVPELFARTRPDFTIQASGIKKIATAMSVFGRDNYRQIVLSANPTTCTATCITKRLSVKVEMLPVQFECRHACKVVMNLDHFRKAAKHLKHGPVQFSWKEGKSGSVKWTMENGEMVTELDAENQRHDRLEKHISTPSHPSATVKGRYFAESLGLLAGNENNVGPALVSIKEGERIGRIHGYFKLSGRFENFKAVFGLPAPAADSFSATFYPDGLSKVANKLHSTELRFKIVGEHLSINDPARPSISFIIPMDWHGRFKVFRKAMAEVIGHPQEADDAALTSGDKIFPELAWVPSAARGLGKGCWKQRHEEN